MKKVPAILSLFISLLCHGHFFYLGQKHNFNSEWQLPMKGQHYDQIKLQIITGEEQQSHLKMKVPKNENGLLQNKTRKSVELKAKVIGQFKIIYPKISRYLKEEGEVIMDVFLSNTGKVLQARLKKSSGHKRLDEAALKQVVKMGFKPAAKMIDGIWINSPSNLELKIVFQLNDKKLF